jgi:hypothetical protein
MVVDRQKGPGGTEWQARSRSWQAEWSGRWVQSQDRQGSKPGGVEKERYEKAGKPCCLTWQDELAQRDRKNRDKYTENKWYLEGLETITRTGETEQVYDQQRCDLGSDWLQSDSIHKYDDLQLDFDFNTNDSWLDLDLSLLTQPELIP